MLLKEKEVQGQALYLEFRRVNTTIQVIITPDGFDTDNQFVAGTFLRRMLTLREPKKRWKSYPLSGYKTIGIFDILKDGVEKSEEEIAELTRLRANSIYDYMNSLVSGGYKLVDDKPIYVEVTKEDLNTIRKGDTPNKVVNRIKAVRTALNFPEEVVTKA